MTNQGNNDPIHGIDMQAGPSEDGLALFSMDACLSVAEGDSRANCAAAEAYAAEANAAEAGGVAAGSGKTHDVTDFVRGRLRRDTGLLAEIAESARKRRIPVCHPEVAALLRVLVRIRCAMRILEAGTAVGFSAATMALAQPAGGIVDTMELDPAMADEAEDNLRALALSSRVRVLRGDAADTMQCLHTPYDLIFLDAAKGQYPDYLAEALRLLAPDGVLIADNVLCRGLVAREQVPHKHRTIHGRLRSFLDSLLDDPSLETSLLEIGDGVTVTVRVDGTNTVPEPDSDIPQEEP